MPRRRALLIGITAYTDPTLKQMTAPAQDVTALAAVLRDPAIGGFEVLTPLIDQRKHEIEEAIEAFFGEGASDDTLLLYFSGHGVKDNSGKLYLAAANTQGRVLRATGVSPSLINDVMRDSNAREQVLLLDCCFAAAFLRGQPAKAGNSVGLVGEFEPTRGRYILASSDAAQYSYYLDEGKLEQPDGSAQAGSAFTRLLVDGLRTGDADLQGDKDGHTSFGDLASYVERNIGQYAKGQRPVKSVLDAQGTSLILARNPNPPKAQLDRALLDALASSLASVRRGVIEDLAQLLNAARPGMAQVAREALEKLATHDDSLSVRNAANTALGNPIPSPPNPALTKPIPTANPSPSAMSLTPEQRAQLRELLARVFDLDDLRTLVFDLGLNHEDISGDTVRARTRELIAFLEKRERLSELIAWARRERPNIDWVNLANPANAKNAEVSAPAPVKSETPPAGIASPKPVADPLVIELPKLNFRLDLVHIPAGPFMMGDDRYDDEKPIHKVTLPEYWIGKYPVTNAQFAAFVQSSKYKTAAEKNGSSHVWNGKEWKDSKGANWQHPTGPGSDIKQKADHPVVHVNSHDAQAFCKWLSGEGKRQVVLPSEAEWENAARGSPASISDIRAYPWGNKEPDNTLCNFGNNEKGTTPVGKYSPKGDSPYGCVDMAGNVWEWTRSLWGKDVNTPEFKYPYVAGDGREDLNAGEDVRRVVRGGAWLNVVDFVRAAYRYGNDLPDVNLGFRVGCVSAPV